MSDPVIPFDFGRMLFGSQDLLFYGEIVFRTLVIYGYTFALLKLFGRRTKSSLSMMDVIVIVALGSAVGDVAFYPNVPLLHCLLVVTLIVGINKMLIWATHQHSKVRDVVEGKEVVVVENGVIQIDKLSGTSVGRDDLLEMLRLKGICNLAQVKLGVLEPSCQISIFKAAEAERGLSILPPDPSETKSGPRGPGKGVCCSSCGVERSSEKNHAQRMAAKSHSSHGFQNQGFNHD